MVCRQILQPREAEVHLLEIATNGDDDFAQYSEPTVQL